MCNNSEVKDENLTRQSSLRHYCAVRIPACSAAASTESLNCQLEHDHLTEQLSVGLANQSDLLHIPHRYITCTNCPRHNHNTMHTVIDLSSWSM